MRYECKQCCYAISGGGGLIMYDKIDAHEFETGHRMEEVENERL